MFPVRQRRLRQALELGACILLVTLIALNALRRMDYLGADTRGHIRLTDASRTAYVAKNIVEGRGYSTNDLPAALVDFYDERGKLHDEHWVNADRFPFGAYLTAALYTLARSTSWEVGLLFYNLLFFVAFLVMLYHATKTIWNDRYAGLFAVTIALLHPYTYMYLYWKDGDMLFMTTAAVLLLVRYYREPPGTISRRFALGLGSLLAFLFLSRPNLGLPFLLFVGASILGRLWASRRTHGTGGALKHHLQHELLIPIAVIAWCIPFVIQSMSAWGSPLFSANSLYQLPLGTRYGMGTDTWWKYTEPGQFPTLALLSERAGDELLAKFTSSWAATIKHVLESHALEVVLVSGLAVWAGSRTGAARAEQRPLRLVALLVGFAAVTNLLLLPLYSYQDFSFRHYLAFGLPLLWMGSGRAISLLGAELRPTAASLRDHLRRHARWYLLLAALGLIAWNLGATTQTDRYRLFSRTSEWLGNHWMGTVLVLVAVLGRRWVLRPPWFPRLTAAMVALVFLYYRPNIAIKRVHFAFYALDDKVWETLRQRQGIVSSFAVQGEVAWMTDRKNIPAPELPMHLYSYLFDHQLEIEDVYLESAQAMIDGPFTGAAPGFEGYARLQTYRVLPGYEVAFHFEGMRGYPKYRIKPQWKASTVFRLVDREAVKAIGKSPDRIELGDPKNVIYTAYGWDQYLTIDGKPVVTGTNVTQARYTPTIPGAWEDAGITFFLDQRRPRAVEFEFYAPLATTYRFYWNLDLYAYDRPKDRAAHEVGAHTAAAAGWQRVRLELPEKLLKKGLNKLGFRRDTWAPTVLCPKGVGDDACIASVPKSGQDEELEKLPVHVVRPDGIAEMRYAVVSLFAHRLDFVY